MNIEDLIYVSEKRLDGDFCKHCIEKFKKDQRVHFRWKVGGDDKHNSSSQILERWDKT